MEKDIITLQELVCYQGEEIARLSDELYAQQKELAVLVQDFQALKKALSTLKSNDSGDFDEREITSDRPPHY